MKRVLAIILGGGAGTRLYPLTKLRAKPAVPLGAKYRLIDIPISNCINSEIHRISVVSLSIRDEVLSAEYHTIRASQGMKVPRLSSCYSKEDDRLKAVCIARLVAC